jgi:hypothetical protein
MPGSTLDSRLAQLREDDVNLWLHFLLMQLHHAAGTARWLSTKRRAQTRPINTGEGNLRRREDESSLSPRMGEPMNVDWLDIDERIDRWGDDTCLVYHNRIFAKGRSNASRNTGWESYLLPGAWNGFRDRCLELRNASLGAAEVPHTENVT